MAGADGPAGGTLQKKVRNNGLVSCLLQNTRYIELGDTPFSFVDRLVSGGYIYSCCLLFGADITEMVMPYV